MKHEVTRRGVLTGAAAASAALVASQVLPAHAEEQARSTLPLPPMNHRYLLSCKLSMVTKTSPAGKAYSLADRFKIAQDAGFDGVDADSQGTPDDPPLQPDEVRAAVLASGVFVHNAINHAHWRQRFTSAKPNERQAALENLQRCIRVSHAAGGNGVLIVVGRDSDGPTQVIEDRARAEIRKAIPLAAALGQRILFENVWSGMFYDHNQGPEQPADRWSAFIDSFNSPWVGMYHDIGNHWKYANPGDWIRSFGHRVVKFDMKGYSRATQSWADIGQGDLPWDDVRRALEDIGFTGWFTAETGGGDVARLKTVRRQMAEVLGIKSA